MDSFTRQYIATALWSSTTGDDSGTPLDRDYDLFQSDMEEDGYFKKSGWYSPEMESY